MTKQLKSCWVAEHSCAPKKLRVQYNKVLETFEFFLKLTLF